MVCHRLRPVHLRSRITGTRWNPSLAMRHPHCDLTLPEIYLERPDISNRIDECPIVHEAISRRGDSSAHDGMIYVERTISGKTRKGIVVALDLECYDYSKGSASLIRATEGTIVDRLPPRIKIRENALLELPHILVLIDDPDDSVIGPIRSVQIPVGKTLRF